MLLPATRSRAVPPSCGPDWHRPGRRGRLTAGTAGPRERRRRPRRGCRRRPRARHRSAPVRHRYNAGRRRSRQAPQRRQRRADGVAGVAKAAAGVTNTRRPPSWRIRRQRGRRPSARRRRPRTVSTKLGRDRRRFGEPRHATTGATGLANTLDGLVLLIQNDDPAASPRLSRSPARRRPRRTNVTGPRATSACSAPRPPGSAATSPR